VVAARAAAAAAAAVGHKRSRGVAAASAAASATSIITAAFQGEVEVTLLSSELEAERAAEAEERRKATAASAGGSGGDVGDDGGDERMGGTKRARLEEGGAGSGGGGASAVGVPKRVPFLFLSLDLPPAPLYTDRDAVGRTLVLQEPLYALMTKYNGEAVTDTLRGQYRERRRYRITKLPPFLVLSVKRFTRNEFFKEKNTTIVTFPVTNFDVRGYVAPAAATGATAATGRASPSDLPTADALLTMPVSDLRRLLVRLDPTAPPATGMEKHELVAAVAAALGAHHTAAAATHEVGSGTPSGVVRSAAPPPSTVSSLRPLAASGMLKYDLCASVVHDSPPEVEKGDISDPLAAGLYRTHVQHMGGGGGQWYELQDLHVAERLPQTIGVAEACLLVYRRQLPVAAGAAGASKRAVTAGGPDAS